MILDIKVNVKIADEDFCRTQSRQHPKTNSQNVATLFKQAQTAMMKGDMDTAKLKLRQIVTYYPKFPMANMAKMMLDKLPK